MARKDKNLGDVFRRPQTAQPRTEQGLNHVTQHSNTDTVSNDVTPNVIQDETQNVTMESIIGKFSEKVETRKQKQRVEDTHKRSTFLFRRDLSDRLDELARTEGSRGFKTMFMNEAIEALLDAYERETEAE